MSHFDLIVNGTWISSFRSWAQIKTYLIANDIRHGFVVQPNGPQWNVRVTPHGTLIRSKV